MKFINNFSALSYLFFEIFSIILENDDNKLEFNKVTFVRSIYIIVHVLHMYQ